MKVNVYEFTLALNAREVNQHVYATMDQMNSLTRLTMKTTIIFTNLLLAQ